MRAYRWHYEGNPTIGPYMSLGCWEIVKVDGFPHTSFTGRPAPEDDGISPPQHIRKQLFYGFESIDSMKAWFTPQLRKFLLMRGFVCSEFDVPDEDVICGSKQVAFPLELDTVISAKRLPLSEILE